MSFIDPDQGNFTPPSVVQSQATGDQPFLDLFATSYLDDTSVGNLVGGFLDTLDTEQRLQGVQIDPNYDPIHDPQTRGYENYLDNYMNSKSSEQTAIAIQRINDTLRRREMLYSNGWKGYMAQFAAGAIDPINFIPFGELSKGSSILKEAGRFAGFGAGSAAIEELAARNREGSVRDAQESLMNMASSTLFMGGLGAGAHWLGHAFTAKQVDDLGEAFRAEIGSVFNPDPAGHASLSAASVPRATLDDMTVKASIFDPGIEMVDGFGTKNWLTGTPLAETSRSPSLAARDAALGMAEDAERRRGEARGVKAQQAVETLIQAKWMSRLAESISELDRQFMKYRIGGDSLIGRIGVTASDTMQAITGKAGAKMSRQEFNKQVALALLNKDTHAIPEVQSVAQHMRKTVFDPLKDEAVKLGLLPEDVKTIASDTYLTRIWDSAKVISKRDQFKSVLMDYFMKEARSEQARSPDEVKLWKQRVDDANEAYTLTQAKIVGAMIEAKKQRKIVERIRRTLGPSIGGERVLKRVVDRLEKELEAARAREAHVNTNKGFAEGDPIVDSIHLARELANGRLKEPPRLVDRIRELGGIIDEDGSLKEAGLHSIGYRRGVVAKDGGKTLDEMMQILSDEGWNIGSFNDKVGMQITKADLIAAIKKDTSKSWGPSKTPVYNEVRDGDAIERWNWANEMLAEIRAVGANVNMSDAHIAYRIGALDEYAADSTPVTRERHRNATWYRERVQSKLDIAKRELDAVKGGLDGRANKLLAARSKYDELNGIAYSLLRERTAYRNVARHYDGKIKYWEEMRGTRESDFQGIIADVINNITSNNGEGMYKPIPLVGRSLKELQIHIPTKDVWDFIEQDAESIIRAHTRQMAADIELSRRFGSADLEDTFDEIRSDYSFLHDDVEETITNKYPDMAPEKRQALIEKEHRRLDEAQRRDLANLGAMRDRITGRASLPKNPEGFLNRASRVARAYNTMRLGGGFLLASLPDVGSIVLSHGLAPVFGQKGLLGLIAGLKSARAGVEEAKRAGIGMDLVLDSHGHRFSDIAEAYGKHTAFERGTAWAADKYGLVNGLAYWTAFMKQWAGAVSASWLGDAVEAAAKGTAKARDLERLAWLGIDKADAKTIFAHLQKYGEKDSGGWIFHTNKWVDGEGMADQAARDMVAAALVKDVNTAIVTPGVGDKPLWLDSATGKVIGQFRSFFLSSMTRITKRALQTRDAQTLQGLVAMTTLGMLAYYLKTPSDQISDDPAVWLKEGVDRSGVTGWLFEANNMMEKFTGNQIGLSPLLGQRAAQRYSSRGFVGNVLGPTVGIMDTAAGLASATASGNFTEGDWNNLSRAVPLWNTFYLKWLRTQFERADDDEGNRQ